MTHPENQPPATPGQYWPPQPQQPAFGPPPGYAPAGPPVKPPNPKLAFWTSPAGIISMLAIMGVVVLVLAGISNRLTGPASRNFDVTVVSCEASTGTLSTATVGFIIRNTSDEARAATVEIEYRDASGARLDTDTVRVATIKAGGVVRHDESTVLNGTATDGIKCLAKVTG